MFVWQWKYKNNTRLCSNQSAIITEEKRLNITTMQPAHQITRRTAKHTKKIKFLVIAIFAVLVLILMIVVVFV